LNFLPDLHGHGALRPILRLTARLRGDTPDSRVPVPLAHSSFKL